MTRNDRFDWAPGTQGPLDLGRNGADNDRYRWVPGTVCSERYSELAIDCGSQLFEPWGYGFFTLVPGTWGKTPDRSADAPNSDSLNELSGPQWVGRFPTSTSLDSLSPTFRSNVQAFLNAIRVAGGTVTILQTRIPRQLAYLMHWAWKIANGKVAAEVVDDRHRMQSVYIQWDHADDQTSIEAAQAMNTLYGTQYPPSLNSNLIYGTAIEMTISGLVGKTIKQKNGTAMLIMTDTATNPTDLVTVGASYGVYHLSADPGIWSVNGY